MDYRLTIKWISLMKWRKRNWLWLWSSFNHAVVCDMIWFNRIELHWLRNCGEFCFFHLFVFFHLYKHSYSFFPIYKHLNGLIWTFLFSLINWFWSEKNLPNNHHPVNLSTSKWSTTNYWFDPTKLMMAITGKNHHSHMDRRILDFGVKKPNANKQTKKTFPVFTINRTNR